MSFVLDEGGDMSEENKVKIWRPISYCPSRYAEHYVWISGSGRLFAKYHADGGWEDTFGRAVFPTHWWDGPGIPDMGSPPLQNAVSKSERVRMKLLDRKTLMWECPVCRVWVKRKYQEPGPFCPEGCQQPPQENAAYSRAQVVLAQQALASGTYRGVRLEEFTKEELIKIAAEGWRRYSKLLKERLEGGEWG